MAVSTAPEASEPFWAMSDMLRSSMIPMPVGFLRISGRNLAMARYNTIETMTGLSMS
tara:strand:+ start:763 stop:933 length:171 start_codon:yes stop_codon:yes gene_type:complete